MVHFEGVSIPNVTIGYATGLHDNTFGLMGIGYPATEGTDLAHEYLDFPYNLYTSGLINTVAYSLWLNDPSRYSIHPIIKKGLVEGAQR